MSKSTDSRQPLSHYRVGKLHTRSPRFYSNYNPLTPFSQSTCYEPHLRLPKLSTHLTLHLSAARFCTRQDNLNNIALPVSNARSLLHWRDLRLLPSRQERRSIPAPHLFTPSVTFPSVPICEVSGYINVELLIIRLIYYYPQCEMCSATLTHLGLQGPLPRSPERGYGSYNT